MPNTSPQFIASGSIYPMRFIMQDTTAPHKCTQASANAQLIGITGVGTNYAPLSGLSIAGYHAESGQPVECHGLGDILLLEAGGTITNGDRLKSDSVGRGVAIATTGTTIQNVGARALQAATASGQMILVQVIIESIRPALV